MEINSKINNDSLVIKPNVQRIDSSISTEFKSKVFDLLDKQYKFILLDISEIDFIDSSGLGALISILKSVTSQNATLAICGAQSKIINLFKLTRMDKVFTLFENVEEAEKFFLVKE